MVKKRSQQTLKKQNTVTAEQAEQLANEISDKPYGNEPTSDTVPVEPEVVVDHIERLTVGIPASMYDDLQSMARRNRRDKKKDLRSMSAIARSAFTDFLEKHNS